MHAYVSNWDTTIIPNSQMFFPPLHSHHLGAMLGLVRCMSFFHNVYKHCGSVVLFKQCFVCLSILNSLWHRLNQWLKFWMRLCVRGSVMTQCDEGDVSSTEMFHLRNLLLYWSRAIFPHIFLLPGVKCCTQKGNLSEFSTYGSLLAEFKNPRLLI